MIILALIVICVGIGFGINYLNKIEKKNRNKNNYTVGSLNTDEKDIVKIGEEEPKDKSFLPAFLKVLKILLIITAIVIAVLIAGGLLLFGACVALFNGMH